MKNKSLKTFTYLGVLLSGVGAVSAQSVQNSVTSYSSSGGSSFVQVQSSSRNGQTQYYINDNGVVHSGTEPGSFSITSNNGVVSKTSGPSSFQVQNNDPQVQNINANINAKINEINNTIKTGIIKKPVIQQNYVPVTNYVPKANTNSYVDVQSSALDRVPESIEVQEIQLNILTRIKAFLDRFF